MKHLVLLILPFIFGLSPNTINVMIIDTGISRHSDLDLVAYDSSENYVDTNGHGTAMAGLVSHGLGRSRLCKNVKIHSCKALHVNAIADCVETATKQGFGVINISMVGETFFQSELDAISKFKGLIFTALGNDKLDLNKMQTGGYPAALNFRYGLSNVIPVQSYCGNVPCKYSNVHDSAVKGYGNFVKTTYLNNSYESMRGTSIAAAIETHKYVSKLCNGR